MDEEDKSVPMDTTASSVCVKIGTELSKSVKAPKVGERVTMTISGTVESVEQEAPDGAAGVMLTIEMPLSGVKLSGGDNAFAELAE